MSYFGQTYEDPEYYDDEADWEDLEDEAQDDEIYGPYITVNS